MMQFIIVKTETERSVAIGPFASRQEAEDYVDEFSGAWDGWEIVQLVKAIY